MSIGSDRIEIINKLKKLKNKSSPFLYSLNRYSLLKGFFFIIIFKYLSDASSLQSHYLNTSQTELIN